MNNNSLTPFLSKWLYGHRFVSKSYTKIFEMRYRIVLNLAVFHLVLFSNTEFAQAGLIYVLQRDSAASVEAFANHEFSHGTSFANAYYNNGYNDGVSAFIETTMSHPYNDYDTWTWDLFSAHSVTYLDHFSGVKDDPDYPRMTEANLRTSSFFQFSVEQVDISYADMPEEFLAHFQRSNIEFSFDGSFANGFDDGRLELQISNALTGEVVFNRSVEAGNYFISGILPGFSDGNSIQYLLSLETFGSLTDAHLLPDYKTTNSTVHFNSYFSLTSVPEPSSLLMVAIGIVPFLARRKKRHGRISTAAFFE